MDRARWEVGMLSYSNGPADQPLIGETIGANLERTTAAFGDREALVDVPSGRRWTYTELNEATDVLAGALIADGIAAGARGGIWAPNCPEWVLLQYAFRAVRCPDAHPVAGRYPVGDQ